MVVGYRPVSSRRAAINSSALPAGNSGPGETRPVYACFCILIVGPLAHWSQATQSLMSGSISP